jgi:hypothetical protein
MILGCVQIITLNEKPASAPSHLVICCMFLSDQLEGRTKQNPIDIVPITINLGNPTSKEWKIDE